MERDGDGIFVGVRWVMETNVTTFFILEAGPPEIVKYKTKLLWYTFFMKTAITKKSSIKSTESDSVFWTRIALEQQALIHAKNGT